MLSAVTEMQSQPSSSYAKNKHQAVRHWLQNIPSASSGNTASPISKSSVIHEVTSPERCTMARSSAAEKSLATLSTSGTIVLFTPVIAIKPCSSSTSSSSSSSKNSASSNTDPFELLGRALSRYHKRIRHVPFHPNVGFTDTHDAFLSQADAVIVVICEPQHHKTDSLGDQIEFAESANDALKESRGSRPLKHPVTLVQCGNSEGSWWPDNSAFETVLHCRTNDVETAQHVARKLFEGRK